MRVRYDSYDLGKKSVFQQEERRSERIEIVRLFLLRVGWRMEKDGDLMAVFSQFFFSL